VKEIHGERDDENLGCTGGDVEKRRLKRGEAECLDDERVLDADTTDEIAEGNEDHEDVWFRFGQSLSESKRGN